MKGIYLKEKSFFSQARCHSCFLLFFFKRYLFYFFLKKMFLPTAGSQPFVSFYLLRIFLYKRVFILFFLKKRYF